MSMKTIKINLFDFLTKEEAETLSNRIADYLTEKYGKYPYGWSLQEELEISLDNVDWID